MGLSNYKLLFEKTKKKNEKKKKVEDREIIKRKQYEDMEVIRERIGQLPSDECLRIKYIRDMPRMAYRATIIKQHKLPHKVKTKDGRIVILQPGAYVKQTWWIEDPKGDWYEQSSKTYQRR